MKLDIQGELYQPDPYVIKSNGKYFMYTTGRNGVQLYVSDDMYSFSYYGLVFTVERQKEYWAPSIIEIDGSFYMYVSFMSEEDDDAHKEHIVVAKSASPYGPFIYLSDLTEPFSIDPHVVKSGNDLYIFYSINDYDAPRAGTLIVVDKMISPMKVKGDPHVVVRATLDEEIFMHDRFKKSQHWHTLEGAFYFRHGDYHYLMFSGNCYQNEKYYIGYAYAYGKEDDLTKLSFQKYPNNNTYYPLISKNQVEEGTGHNSLLEIDGHYYVFYHGRDIIPGEKVKYRTARVAEIKPDKELLEIIKR